MAAGSSDLAVEQKVAADWRSGSLLWCCGFAICRNSRLRALPVFNDNAPEIVAAMRAMKIRHQISRDYISTSNAIAERAARSTLEGTRANLLQAGLHHGYWLYAARH